ncbi:GNAT family N-acetyltransferase [Chelativorans sp. J32]|uniref:GNAT family N-acetyltransferase n=1 Tax=Chelativorans sp. J32 TaxID=935840 RepID=UPI0004B21862|nr:GNAT family N-acetyltransferase [Chelativorans sp. J32]
MAGSAAYSIRVLPADRQALEAYQCFCRGAIYAPPQSPLWIRAWLEDRGADGLIALLSCDGVPALALALEAVEMGPLTFARFAGGRHANGNFPALHPDGMAEKAHWAAALPALLSAIRAERPDIDILALERQRDRIQQYPNPLLTLPYQTSPNLSLAVDLSMGFEKLLRDGSGKRRRRRRRIQLKRLEAAGGYRRFIATTPSEVEELLDLFFSLKSKRLNRMGVQDIFAPACVRASFRRLFLTALDEAEPPFFLHALEAGGKIRAITGSSRTQDSIICEFSTFADDELAHASPGEFLFYENIAETASEGLAFYDFGVGDDPYKRLWCDVETKHADVFIGLTRVGRLAAHTSSALAGIKRMIKQNPAIARLARRARRLAAKS